MNEFYEGLAEILEIDLATVSPDTELGGGWNSLAVVSTIALVDDCFGVVLEGEDLYKCEKVSDIQDLIDKTKKA